MGLFSNESFSSSNFADGVEFEETFPEPDTQEPGPAPTSERPAVPRLTVVRAEPESAPAPEPRADPTGAIDPGQLGRDVSEAEALVRETIERLRLEEETRLAEWARARRAEEEGRLQRIESMLVEWQARFEQRLEQRHADQERVAELRRVSDEERLRSWRADLERALTERFNELRADQPAVAAEVREADPLADAASVRDVGRVLRDLVATIAQTSAFALAMHHTERAEVAYRYRIAADDEFGALLRREALDDDPNSAAAHEEGWVRAQRAIRVAGRNTFIHTAQLAVRAAGTTIGVLSLQSEGEALTDDQLARIAEPVERATSRLAELRARGAFRSL